jgi:hypothetical protein
VVCHVAENVEAPGSKVQSLSQSLVFSGLAFKGVGCFFTIPTRVKRPQPLAQTGYVRGGHWSVSFLKNHGQLAIKIATAKYITKSSITPSLYR